MLEAEPAAHFCCSCFVAVQQEPRCCTFTHAAVCHHKLGSISLARAACCRRTYADLVRQLRLAEIDAEAVRFTRWEKALANWRTLRTQHAMQTFNARIQSPEFAETLERLQLYLRLRELQQAAFLVSWPGFRPGPMQSRIMSGVTTFASNLLDRCGIHAGSCGAPSGLRQAAAARDQPGTDSCLGCSRIPDPAGLAHTAQCSPAGAAAT